jgi:hypothetical protein
MDCRVKPGNDGGWVSARMPASLPQKVEHPGFRQHGFGDAVAP